MTIATASNHLICERLVDAGFEQLVEELIVAARTAGDRVLMRDARRTMNGNELAAAFHAIPAQLAAHGMGPGDVVLFGVRPGIDALLLLLGSMRVGALATFVDPGAGSELFARRIELMQPTWVMAETLLYLASARTPLRPYLRRAGLELPRLASIDARHVRVGRRVPGIVPASISIDELLAAPSNTTYGALPHLDIDDPALVIFTSGTTGAPKGVQHTGRSVTAAIRLMLEHFALPSASLLYNHNIHSFVTGILAGVETIVQPLQFDVGKWLTLVDQERVTHGFLLPVEAYNIVQFCERVGKPLPASLTDIFLYSAPITTGVLERIHALASPDLRVTCAYAMTEMAPVTWIDSREKMAWSGEGDVVGRPCPGVEVRIDNDNELHLRGPNMHRGYAGRERIEWHSTGDLARIDDDGNIVLMGRAKDMIIRGDFNLYPGLYEDTVSQIRGVGACAFIGRPDPVTADEAVVLYVEPDPRQVRDDAALAQRIARELDGGELRLDRKALPDAVRIIDALPRSGRSSKIDRGALRELAAKDDSL